MVPESLPCVGELPGGCDLMFPSVASVEDGAAYCDGDVRYRTVDSHLVNVANSCGAVDGNPAAADPSDGGKIATVEADHGLVVSISHENVTHTA